MTPHIFKSVIHKGAWCCCAKQLSDGPRRYEPVPGTPVVYGANPRHAYERWSEYSKL